MPHLFVIAIIWAMFLVIPTCNQFAIWRDREHYAAGNFLVERFRGFAPSTGASVGTVGSGSVIILDGKIDGRGMAQWRDVNYESFYFLAESKGTDLRRGERFVVELPAETPIRMPIYYRTDVTDQNQFIGGDILLRGSGIDDRFSVYAVLRLVCLAILPLLCLVVYAWISQRRSP